jgi:hypothetical protein
MHFNARIRRLTKADTLRLLHDAGIGIVVLANGTDLDRGGLADLLRSINY